MIGASVPDPIVREGESVTTAPPATSTTTATATTDQQDYDGVSGEDNTLA
jgi:hypothetical protein